MYLFIGIITKNYFEPLKVSYYETRARFGWHDDAIRTYRKKRVFVICFQLVYTLIQIV